MSNLPGVAESLDTRSQLREVRRKNRLLTESLKAKRLERLNARMESYTFDWVSPYVDLLDRYRRNEPEVLGPSSAWHRRYGRNFPVFQSEAELALLRAPARVLAATNSYAIGLLEGLTSYVIGGGYTYRAARKNQDQDATPEALELAVQALIDEFLDRSEWFGGEQPGLEEELFARSVEDGEFILCHTCDRYGRTEVRTAEPEQLTQPPNSDPREWMFGVHTDPDDVQRPLGYYLYFGDTPLDGEEYSPEEITHFRRNSRRAIKRGVTDFAFDTYDTLALAGTLRVNAGDGAAQQAAIVGVMQHAIGGKQDIESFIDDDLDYTATDPITGKQAASRKYRRGQWEHIPQGQSYVPPPNATNGPVHLQILQALLRAAGVRWNAPEWLSSGDASNNNYASSLTAESPFTRTVIRRQRAYGAAFKRTMWQVVENWCRRWGGIDAGGQFWRLEQIKRHIEIEVTPPSPETRNKLEEAQRNQIEISSGYKSPQICANEQGYDWVRVQSDLDAIGGAGGQLPLSPDGDGGGGPVMPQQPQAAQLQSLQGLNAISQLQQQYYSGAIPREAATATLQTLFGFPPQTAVALFPEIAPTKLTNDDQGSEAPPMPDFGAMESEVSDSVGRALLEAGFTGMITDKIGRKRYYVNGKAVKKEVHDQAGQQGESTPVTPPAVVEPPPKKAVSAAEAKAAAKQVVKQDLANYMANPGAYDPAKTQELAKGLNTLTVPELKEQLKAMKEKLPATKAKQIDAITAALSKSKTVADTAAAAVAAATQPAAAQAAGVEAIGAGLKLPVPQNDKAANEKLVKQYLASKGVTATDMLGSGTAMQIAKELQSAGLMKGTMFEVEYSLQNLAGQEAKQLIKPMFAKRGATNAPNLNLPKESRPQLTGDEQVAAQKYTTTAYRDINEALREGTKVPGDKAKIHEDLKSAFEKAQPFDKPVMVSRSITLSEAKAKELVDAAIKAKENGQPAVMPGYISTSSGAKIKAFDGNIEMRIQAKHGLDLKPYTHYPHENEMLLNHNSEFKVTGVTQTKDGKWRIDLEQIYPPTSSAEHKLATPRPDYSKAVPANITRAYFKTQVDSQLASRIRFQQTGGLPCRVTPRNGT